MEMATSLLNDGTIGGDATKFPFPMTDVGSNNHTLLVADDDPADEENDDDDDNDDHGLLAGDDEAIGLGDKRRPSYSDATI